MLLSLPFPWYPCYDTHWVVHVASWYISSVTDGYDSEAGAPDDTDRPEDDAEELELWRVS